MSTLLQELLGRQNVFVIHRCMIDAFDKDWYAAAMVEQITFHMTDYDNEERDDFVVKSQKEWCEALRITEHAYRTSKSKLEALGVLETKIFRVLRGESHTQIVGFRVNLESLGALVAKTTQVRPRRKTTPLDSTSQGGGKFNEPGSLNSTSLYNKDYELTSNEFTSTKAEEVETPQSQAPTLQNQSNESVGSHQRISDSLVKTVGEEVEIEIEMADEAGSSSGNLSDQIAERSKKRSAKPTSKFGRGAATKNKSSLETPTPQGNNSSPHSAAPPKASRAWYASASLASHEMPFAELCWEDAFVRVKAQHPLEFRHFAKVGEAAARELILSALEQLTAEERSGSGFPWLLMKRVAQTVPASRPTMDAGSPNQPQWQEVTLPNGKTRWERWFINPITRQRDVQVQPVDESLPDRGRPTGANQRSRHDADD